MTYAIVYSSRTGNTRMLADTLHTALPAGSCLYFGEPAAEALNADRLYVGFWTDKGTCDADTAAFLKQIRGKEVFLFGTAGFGADPAYYDRILTNVRKHLDSSVTVLGGYMCQGKMPMSVRDRYEAMLKAPVHMPNLPAMIENFDKALTHPDAADLQALAAAVHKEETNV